MDWTHLDPGRIERAKSVNISEIVNTDEEASCRCIGSKGSVYRTTLTSCDCGDFRRLHEPCKHMIRLAMEIGILNENGMTDEQKLRHDQKQVRDQLALAFGNYYLFHTPIITNEQYDALKIRYEELKLSDVTFYSLEEFITLCDENHVRYVDKTSSNGCFWVEDCDFICNIVKKTRVQNCEIKKAFKSRAFSGKPAFYILPPPSGESENLSADEPGTGKENAALNELFK